MDFFLGPPTNWLTLTKSVINQSLMNQFVSNKVWCHGNNVYYQYNRYRGVESGGRGAAAPPQYEVGGESMFSRPQ